MKTLTMNQMEICDAMGKGESVACSVLMEMAGAPWEIGIGMVATPLAAFLFSMGWAAFSAYVCSEV